MSSDDKSDKIQKRYKNEEIYYSHLFTFIISNGLFLYGE